MKLYRRISSPLGELLLTAEAGKLTGLYFADKVPELARLASLENEAPLFRETARQLREYAESARREFDLPLGLSGTPFQMKVWMEMARIPFGETISYAELAERIGAAGSSRAVGAAAGRNPLCWVVPCHRVVGKSGALTGYAGGLERKRLLLDFEAARRADEPVFLGGPAEFAAAA